uniref:Uncharacterized protein n=1 Tax=Proboscia inermis TaxID=420281 RepID=A0A7S0C8H1_9STRA|mmetsp:Transcript_34186/g.34375  ORF Transcript_34186/g.34375 Transcript_34186/m.34375 type:complete len:268 (+) Transcript_34186:34-837(+)
MKWCNEKNICSFFQLRDELARVEFLLEARQVKMLRDLRDLYPIQTISNNASNAGGNVTIVTLPKYAIRGLELPADMNFVDEHVSSALGYVCHMVYMASKYLHIPLRYRLICNASRSFVVEDTPNIYPSKQSNGNNNNVADMSDGSKSSIVSGATPSMTDAQTLAGVAGIAPSLLRTAFRQQHNNDHGFPDNINCGSSNGGAYYPLFREKMERESFDRAVLLLERNIECLLKKRRIAFVPRSHLLAKLDRLFEQTATVGGGGELLVTR